MNGSRPSCDGTENHTPKCTKVCEKGYTVPYPKDRHFGKKSYSIRSQVPQIQKEIMTNGPVEGAFTVYEDLLHYKSGKCLFLCLIFIANNWSLIFRSVPACNRKGVGRTCDQDIGMGR